MSVWMLQDQAHNLVIEVASARTGKTRKKITKEEVWRVCDEVAALDPGRRPVRNIRAMDDREHLLFIKSAANNMIEHACKAGAFA